MATMIHPVQKYVFSIIQSRKEVNFGPIGFGGGEVYTVHYKDLAAVVCDTDKNALSILKEGLTHQKVNETIMERFTGMPFRFGMIPRDENDVKGFLSKYYVELKKTFARIDGKAEFGLKAYFAEKFINERISELKGQPQVKALTEKISRNPREAYRLKIDLGKLIADTLSREGEQMAQGIFQTLSPLAVETRRNEIMTDQMILNAAFLVDRQGEWMFDQHVDLIEDKNEGKIRLKYVGPCPPYNFVKMEV
ncbi:MAG: GvpL/GvpF family gas vesicle protein [Candidatus Bathyarchaeota archaeon]